MLGNWSFGDYFKKEAIAWAWELLTEVWSLDKTRLHATVFEGEPGRRRAARRRGVRVLEDDDRHRSDAHPSGQQEGQLLGDGRDRPVRPLHRDPLRPHAGQDAAASWSTRARRTSSRSGTWCSSSSTATPDRSLTPLPAKHVDTGMGFERVTAVIQGKDEQLRHRCVHADLRRDSEDDRSGGLHGQAGRSEGHGLSRHRRPHPHADLRPDRWSDARATKAAVMCCGASCGGRSAMAGSTSAPTKPFLCDLVPTVVDVMGHAFPELKKNPGKVAKLIQEEEESFIRTLDRGIKLFRAKRRERAPDRPAANVSISGEGRFSTARHLRLLHRHHRADGGEAGLERRPADAIEEAA